MDNAPTHASSTSTSRRTRAKLFPNTASSIPRARVLTTQVLSEWAAVVDVDVVRLCVSELCTNALQHGKTPGRLFMLCLSLTDAELLVEVHDSNPALPKLREAAPTDPTGRGLRLVEVFAARWGTSPRRSLGKVVWCAFPLAPQCDTGEDT
ncbi:ATP-binding protein [Streptomyces sp. B8F3]|uniref:ATP-binding protein n=1 Tax=unclassified Streptomyces TaxID=2593676 RepID=UPI00325E457E